MLMITGWRIALIAGAGAVVAAAAYALPLTEWAVALAERARAAGVIAYVAATVAVLPGSLLTLAAGFAYGPVWGLAVASPASVAGATTAFLLGRTLLRDRAIRRTAHAPRVAAIWRAVDRQGFKVVLLLPLSPLVPFNILNYALSLSNLRVRTYIGASVIGMLPGTALYVYLGSLAPTAAQLSTAAERGGPVQVLLYVGGRAAAVAVAVIATRAGRRALREELERAA